jgi:predicted PurR-regulated permease PerM
VSDQAERVPSGLRLAAAIAWRALVVAAAVVALALLLARLRVIVVPVAVAILLSTFLVPPARFLRGRGWPRALAAVAVVVAALVLAAGAVAALVPGIVRDVGEVDASVRGGVDQVTELLTREPFSLSERRVEEWTDRAEDELRSRSSRLVGGLFGGAFLVLELLAGLALAVVTLFFLVKDGDRLWRSTVRLFPERTRPDVEEIGRLAWETAGGYIRGVSLVALFDAVLIGLAIWLVGVPFVLPLAALTFLGGFFPIVGAVVAGFVAAMVALVANGWVAALVVVGAIVLVQQLESNVLQPFVVGSAVRVHPLGILLAISAGGILWGVAGAFLAVPLVAVASKAAAHLAGRRPADATPEHAEARPAAARDRP